MSDTIILNTESTTLVISGDTAGEVLLADAAGPIVVASDVPGPVGATGPAGQDGADGSVGWSPLLSATTGGSGYGFYITDWIGGVGTKPATGQYLGQLSSSSIVYDDSNTHFGVTTLQGAIEFLATGVSALVDFDFSNGNNFAVGIFAGAI